MSDVTRLLGAAHAGDADAAKHLLPLVYDELRRLARARMCHEPAAHTLQPTALVHEAYLRVVGDDAAAFAGRAHFFASAGIAMRRILVDHARQKASIKRGGDAQREELFDIDAPADLPITDVIAVDDAVKKLEREDPRKGEIVNLRYFAGLSRAETAIALDLSEETIAREWRFIRVWLQRELGTHDGR